MIPADGAADLVGLGLMLAAALGMLWSLRRVAAWPGDDGE